MSSALFPDPVFLDAAAGEPMDPVAREAYLAALEDGWADPDRLYHAGRRARLVLDAAREAVAEVVGARPDEVAFTSSGTAAVHAGVLGVARARARTGGRIAATAVEHSSVLHAAQFAAPERGPLLLGVSRLGALEIGTLAAALAAGPVALACVQSANHEVGTVQPVGEAWALCVEAGVPLLVDAAASLGRADLPEHWSVLCGSARKWGGPAGIGLLAVRRGTRFAAANPEDERERGRVPGPVNVPGALAAAAALRARAAERGEVAARQRAQTDRIRAFAALIPDVQVVGDPVDRLPHLVTFSSWFVSGEALLTELDKAGFAVSSGSSCTASTMTPSHVLEAMGAPSQGNIRVSLPWRATDEEVDRFLAVLPGLIESLRLGAPLAPTVREEQAASGSGVLSSGAEAASGSSVVSGAEAASRAVPAPAATSESSDSASAAVAGPAADPAAIPVPALVLDTLGRRCPIPVIEVAKRISAVEIGQTVAVWSDDAAARLDLPVWCELRGHTYLGAEPVAGKDATAVAYLIRREH
ncbi:MAG TPA: aminotransferase class V-fold PLP-dependent enzyme [Actinocrinis sp.]|nr:aminotransferase class V-fold PLP-dependent enzyme [Actinocrinis sp.]